jgi:hypothetical protein
MVPLLVVLEQTAECDLVAWLLCKSQRRAAVFSRPLPCFNDLPSWPSLGSLAVLAQHFGVARP